MEEGPEGAGEASAAQSSSEPHDALVASTEPAEETSATRSFKIVHPRKLPKKAQTSSPKARSPLLPYASATLGLVSLLLPWIVIQSYHGEEYARLMDYMSDPFNYDAVYAIVGVLVLAGSVLVLLSSYGSLLTLAGVAVFALDWPSGTTFEAGIGLPVAAAAAMVGCTSIVWSPSFKLPPRLLSVKADPQGGYRINLLAYAAFAIGVASIVLYWLVIEQYVYGLSAERGYTLASLIGQPSFGSGTGYIVAEALIVAGAVLCLLTPLGGVTMLCGTLLFFQSARDLLGTSDMHMFDTSHSEVALGYGFYVCLIASILATVSIFKAYEPRIHIASMAAAGSGPAARGSPRAETKATMAALVKAAAKPAALAALVVLMLVASVMVSFAMPLSTLVVEVTNGDSSSVLEVSVLVDGELVDQGLASEGSNFFVETAVTAGVHRVELDYALLDFVPEGPDGLPDWHGSVDVRPYVRSALYVPVFVDDLALPIVTLEASSTPDGERISVAGCVNYGYGVEFEAFVAWYSAGLVLTDGSSFARWGPVHVETTDASVAQTELDAVVLGDLNISCTVTDLAGDSAMSTGDYFDLAVTSGSFAEDVTYTLYVLRDTSVVGEVSFTG